jgi:hypothetical protein
MDGPGQLLGQQLIHPALAGNPAGPCEERRHDLDVEVGLALGPGAGMPGMAVGIIPDGQPRRLQRRGKLRPDTIGDAHAGATLAKPPQPCQGGDPMLHRARLSGLVVNPILMRMPRASIESSAGPSAAATAARLCDHPGCSASGDYRAPRSRDRLHVFFWFCLDHVRAYNAQWNYYAGMSTAEIEAEIRNDTVWQRPTWPMGSRCGIRFDAHVRDFGLFGFEDEDAELRERPKKRPLTEQEQALAVFELSLPLTMGSLKARYKTLVKLHHPDAHGGDRAAEERLKVINQAYSTLKSSYFPSG